MLIDQCSADAAQRARALRDQPDRERELSGPDGDRPAARDRAHTLAVLPIAAKTVRGNRLVGWTFPDEPEGDGWTPASLQRAHPVRRGTRDGLLTFMTTGAGFYRSSYTPTSTSQAVYGQYARLADVAGFDLYPLGHCNNELGAVYDAQRVFNQLAGKMPTFQWIETGAIKPEYCGGFKMQPAELRAEVWLAVAGGARGIGYFTHTWSPEHKAFDVSPAIEHAIGQTNNLLSAVRPALLGQTILSGVNSTSVKVVARRAGNTTYVIAVNAARAPINVQFQVPAPAGRQDEVFGERRSLPVHHDRLVDAFQPLGVHIYVQQR